MATETTETADTGAADVIYESPTERVQTCTPCLGT